MELMTESVKEPLNIEPSSSLWFSPVTVVPKKDETRFYMDYQKLRAGLLIVS